MSKPSKQCNSRHLAEESQVIRNWLVLENLQIYESWCEFEIDHSVYCFMFLLTNATVTSCPSSFFNFCCFVSLGDKNPLPSVCAVSLWQMLPLSSALTAGERGYQPLIGHWGPTLASDWPMLAWSVTGAAGGEVTKLVVHLRLIL